MTTRELVVRMAMAGLGAVDEIWDWPLHYYLMVRREYIKIAGLAPGAGKSDDGVTRRTVGPDITVETYSAPG